MARRHDPDKGMPVAIEEEKFILGSILLDGDRFSAVAATLVQDDFSLEKHRRIFSRMLDMNERGDKIDRVTLASELMKRDELESVDGLSYLVSLDDGIPHIANISSYINIVRDKAALRRIAMSCQYVMNQALLGAESPEDILAGAEERLLGIGESRHADAGLQHSGEFLRNFPGGFNAFAEPSKRDAGIPTGFSKLDDMTGGLRPGELWILGARPSVGKSAAAMGIAWHVAAKRGEPVAVFSLEMSTESLLLRILCSAARIDSQRLRAGYLNEQERAKIRSAANQMLEAPLYIDDSSDIGLLELHSKLRRLKKQIKRKLGLVVVDYLQLMARPGKGDNANQDLSRLSRGLKLMAREMECPFLVLSQLSRATETRAGDKRPILSDLRDSGSIEADADVVGFLYRPIMHHRDREDLRGLAEWILSKQRQGPCGTINLVFLDAQVRFENRAEDLSDLPPDEERLPFADD